MTPEEREILEEVAGQGCEAWQNGWLNCDEREKSELMFRGYKCLSCRAEDALNGSA